MMLQFRDDDLITGPERLAAITLRDQVDGLGGAAHKDHFLAGWRVDKLAELVPGRFIFGRGLLAERVQAAMNVGVIFTVVTGQRLDNPGRFLRGRGVVEIDQRLAAHGLLQHGKIRADRLKVKCAGLVGQSRGGVNAVHGQTHVSMRRRAVAQSPDIRGGCVSATAQCR